MPPPSAIPGRYLLFMELPTIRQYRDVISDVLSPRQIEVLQVLYYFPNSSATAKSLADVLNYSGFSAANRIIGQIGKAISFFTGIVPPDYYTKGKNRPAFFSLVGEYYQDTGWNMWDRLRTALEKNKVVSKNLAIEERLPTELFQFEEESLFREGKAIKVYVNKYERDQRARLECIKFYKAKCVICGFDFGDTYGQISEGFIHVHHLIPLSDIKEEYEVDPVSDLRPVCANCHSVIHMTKPAMTIDAVRKLIRKNSR